MNAQTWTVMLLTLAVALVLTLVVINRGKTKKTRGDQPLPPPPVQLSIVEQCCLQTLQQVAGREYNIRNKVSPTALALDGAEHIRQRLDFVLFGKKSGKPACVVQLKSATNHDETVLDKALADAELPLYRLPRKSSYSFLEISELLAPHLETPSPSPDEMLATISMQAFHVCSKCQSPMSLKRASSGPHKGVLFWVCPGYPGNCSGVELYNE
ncbi:Protein of unknown function (DUF2726) [Mariprofundus ferrinatatus]|uniref:Uncharacterized protein n=1 Tax=Mariprofundus ferrinatatus TaxID=1921087 RepID=A0A2K8L1M7_9PROT|nr:DUF2726 domain-containing protein [Mariprofundus ferrinatatus]ATX81208.1 Protein of unknown function (DUF2726) [Mariprofundus ferrinatatus]